MNKVQMMHHGTCLYHFHPVVILLHAVNAITTTYRAITTADSNDAASTATTCSAATPANASAPVINPI